MYENKDKNDIYNEFKDLLKGTEVENYFDDQYAFAYIEQERELIDGLSKCRRVLRLIL